MREENSGRGLKLLRWASRITAVLALVALCWIGMTHPKTPLPPEWNPLAPLDIRAPLAPITKLKFQRALHDPELCRAALATGAIAREMSDRVENEVCHIRNRVSVESVAEVRLAPVEMRCDLALRTAMWAEHGLKPAAKRLLGTDLTQIDHFSSYNCRAIRTPEGGSTRMSLHATAEALDVSGFRFTDGQRLTLKRDWETAPFLHAARDSACTWFATTLGPEYNALHADHFHLQSRGWGRCS